MQLIKLRLGWCLHFLNFYDRELLIHAKLLKIVGAVHARALITCMTYKQSLAAGIGWFGTDILGRTAS